MKKSNPKTMAKEYFNKMLLAPKSEIAIRNKIITIYFQVLGINSDKAIRVLLELNKFHNYQETLWLLRE